MLYPIQGLGVIASNGTLGLSRGKGRDTRGSSGGGEIRATIELNKLPVEELVVSPPEQEDAT